MQPPARLLIPFIEGGPRSSASGGPEAGGTEVMASEEGVIEEETEESRRPRIAKIFQMPTKAEYDAHMTLHVDYRNWCPDCVAGRGISHQHKACRNERTGRDHEGQQT